MTDPETLLALADRIRRLGPDRHDPERYHVEKSEIAAELRRLAQEKKHAVASKSTSHTVHRCA
jgi:hypothetical protein